MCAQVPLLLVDVDGVISLFGFDPLDPPETTPCTVDGLPHFLSIEAGRHLSRLARTFECVWCTGWEERAGEHLPALLSLPRGWPHLSFDGTPSDDGRHWKLAAIDAYAGPHRPIAWIDDALDDRCEEWMRERTGPTLLLRTDPATGLITEHVERLEAFARQFTDS